MSSDSQTPSLPKTKKPYKKPEINKLNLNNLTKKQAKMIFEINKKRQNHEKG